MTGDYYRILGVSRAASTDEIKKRYRELAMRFHPDRNPEDYLAGEHFKTITEAYGVLVDPAKRRVYDGRPDPSFDRRTVYEDIFARADFREVFEGLPLSRAWIERLLDIGRIVAYEAIVVGGPRASVLRRSAARIAAEGMSRAFHAVMDVHEHVVLPRTLARNGGFLTLEYRPGIRRRHIRVKIPPGTNAGTVLRIRGMGRRNPINKSGDLYLHVAIEGL